MSILNMPCPYGRECQDDDCPGIHQADPPDWLVSLFVLVIAGGLGLLAWLGERGWLS